MCDSFSYTARYFGVRSGVVCACLLLTGTSAQALDVGFQGLLQLEGSDNIEGVNSPDEENGTIQSGVLSVFGEQRSTVVTAAFQGELDIRNTTTDDDSDVDSISRFLGAAEFKLTPRSWTWYVGDILGGVRNDDALQPIDDTELQRRNVFVTGPAFEYEEQGISRTTARALFVNQSEDSDSLETLYSVNFRHERDLTTGSYYGIRLGNIYTDSQTEDDAAFQGAQSEEDFNRATFGVFYNRQIRFLTLFGELGATRFDADSESLDGLNAELRATQQLGRQSSVSVYVNRDLGDQTLRGVESLLQSGATAVGIAPDSAGFFTETSAGAQYNFESTDRVFSLSAEYSQLDFDTLTGSEQSFVSADAEDRSQVSASAFWSQRLSRQLRSELSISYENQDFDNIEDNSESVLVGAQLIYALSRSFDLLAGITHDNGSGLRTLFTEINGIEEDLDITENRVSIGLRWAPPTRASQELTVELRSLLQ